MFCIYFGQEFHNNISNNLQVYFFDNDRKNLIMS